MSYPRFLRCGCENLRSFWLISLFLSHNLKYTNNVSFEPLSDYVYYTYLALYQSILYSLPYIKSCILPLFWLNNWIWFWHAPSLFTKWISPPYVTANLVTWLAVFVEGVRPLLNFGFKMLIYMLCFILKPQICHKYISKHILHHILKQFGLWKKRVRWTLMS